MHYRGKSLCARDGALLGRFPLVRSSVEKRTVSRRKCPKVLISRGDEWSAKKVLYLREKVESFRCAEPSQG